MKKQFIQLRQYLDTLNIDVDASPLTPEHLDSAFHRKLHEISSRVEINALKMAYTKIKENLDVVKKNWDQIYQSNSGDKNFSWNQLKKDFKEFVELIQNYKRRFNFHSYKKWFQEFRKSVNFKLIKLLHIISLTTFLGITVLFLYASLPHSNQPNTQKENNSQNPQKKYFKTPSPVTPSEGTSHQQGFGFLQVHSDPWASFTIRDANGVLEISQEVPTRRFTLSEGKHHFSIQKEGYRPMQRDFLLLDQQNLRIIVNLSLGTFQIIEVKK